MFQNMKNHLVNSGFDMKVGVIGRRTDCSNFRAPSVRGGLSCRRRTTTTTPCAGCKGLQINNTKFHYYSLWAQDTFIQALSERTSRKKTQIECLKVEHVQGQCTFTIYFTTHRRKRIAIASSRIQKNDVCLFVISADFCNRTYCSLSCTRQVLRIRFLPSHGFFYGELASVISVILRPERGPRRLARM
jgi:hypothetical protein